MNQMEPLHWTAQKAAIWRALQTHYANISSLNVSELLSENQYRIDRLSLEVGDLFLDFSKNLIDNKAIELLVKLADASNLEQKIEQLMDGVDINTTERRPALHTVLRMPPVSGTSCEATVHKQKQVHEVLDKMEIFCQSIHSGQWLGYTNKPITNIVNIGVGGSDLGPKMACHALDQFSQAKVNSHFVSNIDDTDLGSTLSQLNPETTLFIVASKSFTTLETMRNAENARAWFLRSANEKNISKHFVAVSSNVEKALAFGIHESNVFPMWDWVGGRYSIWSSIGLSIALLIGMTNFKSFLAGGHEMDLHFKNTPFEKNAPVMMGLIGIIYGNMLNAQSQAIIPYDENLALFPDYLQQLEMESNGKRVSRDGHPINYQTGQILWGNTGTNSQHSFHQLFHQGTHLCGIDFLLPLSSHYALGDQHLLLVANCLAQSQALMNGKSEKVVKQELQDKGLKAEEAARLAPHLSISGNKPSTIICYEKMTPKVLGQLVALYEHKVYVQSVIWDINAFDQWGVELGKQLSRELEPYLRSNRTQNLENIDSSTAKIITRYHRFKNHA